MLGTLVPTPLSHKYFMVEDYGIFIDHFLCVIINMRVNFVGNILTKIPFTSA
jgi:hypothetical protein